MWKALLYLGYKVDVWDTYVSKRPPTNKKYDVCLAWTNQIPERKLINANKKILYYLDDTTGYESNPKYKIEEAMKGFDYVFTCHITRGFEDKWIPVGCEPKIHKPVKEPEDQMIDVVFIGTLREEKRKKFVLELSKRCQQENIDFRIIGNNWNGSPMWVGKPLYFSDFNIMCNRARILINHHYNTAPSTKVHEIAAAGGGMLISDRKDAVLKCYPKIPCYESVEDCIKKIKYYLGLPRERKSMVDYLLKLSKNFTYQKQIKELMRRANGL